MPKTTEVMPSSSDSSRIGNTFVSDFNSELLKVWSNTIKRHLLELGEHEDSVNLIREGALPQSLEQDFPQSFTILPIDESASPEERERIEVRNALSKKLQHEVEVTRKISQAHFQTRQQISLINEQRILTAEHVLNSVSPEDFSDVWSSLKAGFPRGVSYRIDSLLQKLEQIALDQEEEIANAATKILDQMQPPPAETNKAESLLWQTFLVEVKFKKALHTVLQLMAESGIELKPEDVTYDMNELIDKASTDTQFDDEAPEGISDEALLAFRIKKFHDQKMHPVHEFCAQVKAHGKNLEAIQAVDALEVAESMRKDMAYKNATHRISQGTTIFIRKNPRGIRGSIAEPSVISDIQEPSDEDAIFNKDEVLHGDAPISDVQPDDPTLREGAALEDEPENISKPTLTLHD